MEFDPSDALNALKNAQTIVVAGHENPDGDAVGACFAVALAIEKAGKTPIVLLGRYSKRYDLLVGASFVKQDGWEGVSADAFIALDCGGAARLGKAEEVFARTPVTVCIDHHMHNPGFAQFNFVDEAASSTCEVVYRLLGNSLEISSDMATALYAGIVFDTGGFRHGSTNPGTMAAAAGLMQTGIDFSEIQRQVLYVHSLQETKIFARALERMKIADSVPMTYTFLTLDDMEEAGADYSDLDGIVEYILNVEGMEAAVFLTERPGNQVKASFRSRKMDINKVASAFGGGGHLNACGATLYMPLKEAVETVLPAVAKEIEEYCRHEK